MQNVRIHRTVCTDQPRIKDSNMPNVRIYRTVCTDRCGQGGWPAPRCLCWEPENARIQWTVLPDRTWRTYTLRTPWRRHIDLWNCFEDPDPSPLGVEFWGQKPDPTHRRVRTRTQQQRGPICRLITLPGKYWDYDKMLTLPSEYGQNGAVPSRLAQQ